MSIWKDIAIKPEGFRKVLFKYYNECENKYNYLIGCYHERTERCDFIERLPKLLEDRFIHKNSKYKRFSDEWSFDDYDGDYCIIKEWLYLDELEDLIKQVENNAE